MRRRTLAWILALAMLLTLAPLGQADGAWTCPSCGQEGNTGNFCSNCATPRPDGSKPAPETAPQAAVNENLEQIPGVAGFAPRRPFP